MKPKELSYELRHASGQYMARRRGIASLSLVAAGSMALISLYQLGIIKHLPGPPLPHFDADEVDAARRAYAYLSMPDAVLGLNSYATTLALASMGGQDRAETKPWLPLLMAAKVLVDAGQAAKLTVDQWVKHRAFCSWCLLAAAATFLMLPLMIPEALAAYRHLRQE